MIEGVYPTGRVQDEAGIVGVRELEERAWESAVRSTLEILLHQEEDQCYQR